MKHHAIESSLEVPKREDTKMYVFKPLFDRTVILALWVLLVTPLWAGSPFNMFVPEDNSLTSSQDDQARVQGLYWGRDEVYFSFISRGGADFETPDPLGFDILLPHLNDHDITSGQVIEGMNRALDTWNSAWYADFGFGETVFDANLWPPIEVENFAPYTPFGIAIDGYNVITFQDEDTFAGSAAEGELAVVSMTFFNRPFDFDELLAGQSPGVPFEFLGVVFSIFEEEVTGDEILILDFNHDLRIDMFISEFRKYEAGELIDVDIAFDPLISYRMWPEDRGDLTSNDEQLIKSSPDIQAILTTQLGFARGMGASTIVDSSMYPFLEGRNSRSPTDPYLKRALAFDDQVTVAIVDGADPRGGGVGAISGQVLEGSVVDGFDVEVDDEGNVTQGADDDTEVDEFVVQVPVFLAVSHVQVLDSKTLGGGIDNRFDPTFPPHPDDRIAESVLGDENDGPYRAVCQILSGQGLILARGAADAEDADEFFFEIPREAIDDNDDSQNDEIEGGLTIEDDAAFEGRDVFNSTFTFPGLPSRDDNGAPIRYALSLTEEGFIGEIPLNPVHEEFQGQETFDPEFYGGPSQVIEAGTGQAPIEIFRGDNRFENGFITAEVDSAARFSAAINDNTPILSGFGSGPSSFVAVTSPVGTFSNRFTAIGPAIEGVTIEDVGNEAQGRFLRTDDFGLTFQMRTTENGGDAGVASGLQVAYTIENPTLLPRTYTIRQVLDTFLFGRENPVYTIEGAIISRSTTLRGAQIPEELIYQTSKVAPAYRAFVNLRGRGVVTPDRVTIGTLAELDDPEAAGTELRTATAASIDSGIALVWEDVLVLPRESVLIGFNFGFLQPGILNDSWVPFPDGTTDLDELTGLEDDPGRAILVEVVDGEITDGIDIITNTGEDSEGGIPPIDPIRGFASGPLRFERADNGGFPPSDAVTMHGALGDIDNDGDLDVYTANFGGGEDPVGSRINRLYMNEQRIRDDGTIETFYRDLTFGEDGIANTSDDHFDLHVDEKSVGVAFADFDGDGDLDIFVSNIEGPNRFYLNEGPDPDRIGFYTDISADVLPGLLNRGWDPNDGFTHDVSFRPAVGDIDGDGDLDLVISQRRAFPDGFLTSAWCDISPRDDDFPTGDRLMDSRSDRFSEVLLAAERVLINQTNQPNYSPYKRGFYFVDETLGSDDRFGTLTSLVIERAAGPFGTNEAQRLVSFNPTEIDRMPPVLPPMATRDEDGNFSWEGSPMGTSAVESRLAPFFRDSSLDLFSLRANNRQLFLGGHMPVSMNREGDEGFETIGDDFTGGDIPDHGIHAAHFRNLDVFSVETGQLGSDGVADGYFSCLNYNMDYGASPGGPSHAFMNQFNEDNNPTVGGAQSIGTGHGLFCLESDSGDPNGTLFRYDAFPLFIGFPQGHSCDVEPDGFVETDITSRVQRGGWGAYVGDWENRGAPRPLVASDNDAQGGAPFTSRYDIAEGGVIISFAGKGVSRGQGQSTGDEGEINVYGGNAVQYRENYSQIYHVFPLAADTDLWPENTVPPAEDSGQDLAQLGESQSVTAGDFDRDGDLDFMIFNSTEFGISRVDSTGAGTFILNGAPVGNQVFLNDGYGNFTDTSATLSPNNEVVSMFGLNGDVDNDGDYDILVFNAGERNEIFLNQIFSDAPDVFTDEDPTLFYEATREVLPGIAGVALAPPFNVNSAISGFSVTTTVSDLNSDGRPDMIIAEGGRFTTNGDFARVLLNQGKTVGDSVPVFQPGGSDHPGPRVDLFEHNFEGLMTLESLLQRNFDGFVGDLAATTDVGAGDVDNDGDNDLVIAHSGTGAQLLINRDSDIQIFNMAPDADSLGDAIFDISSNIPILEDSVSNPLGLVLKQQNRKLKMADFNNDGLLDIVIANGLDNSGAPNVLLMNNPGNVGSYLDRTEQNLPVEENGGVIQGVIDNTQDVLAADFNHDGFVDIMFANETNGVATPGFRLLLNDGTGVFTDSEPGERVPEFALLMAQGMTLGDYDGLGEPTEDVNFNGYLDPGEDLNGNGIIDWVDLPSEEESGDTNGDGIVTVREDDVWEGSIDVYISFDDSPDRILINDPTNMDPGVFDDDTERRFPPTGATPTRGCASGDIDLDGDLDIVVSRFVGGITRHVTVWVNTLREQPDGTLKLGFFEDASYEVPFGRANSDFFEVETGQEGENEDSRTGWANDVDLFDYDLDGDLDMMITCTGPTRTQAVTGAQNFFYVNRIVGDGLNFQPEGLNRAPGNPVVFEAQPAGSLRGATMEVFLVGDNFSDDLAVSFGGGIEIMEVDRRSRSYVIVKVHVREEADLGPRRISVQNMSGGGSTTTKSGIFTVYEQLANPIPENAADPIWMVFE